MSKYSYQFKLKIVLEYLNGTLGYNKLAKKYGLSDSILVRRWVNQYKTYGIEGLQTKKRKNKYSLPFKLDVLKFKQDTGASYTSTANAFGIAEPSIIANWKRIYLEEGAAGLNKKARRPPKMPKSNPNQDKIKGHKKNQNKTEITEINDEIEFLKKENEYLKIEVAYLKKLKALGLKDPRANNKQE